MKTTLFGSKIIEAAEELLSLGYRDYNKRNYGAKLEQVVEEFNGSPLNPKKKGKNQGHYCAVTQSVILDRATRKYNGSANKYRNAFASWFLNYAKTHGIRVDKNPQPGCLFVTKNIVSGSGNHVGMVWKNVTKTGFWSIEGNTESRTSYIMVDGCKVVLKPKEGGIVSRYREKANIYMFLHFEEAYGTALQEFPDSETSLADSGEYCFVGEMEEFDDGEGPVYNENGDQVASDGSGTILLTVDQVDLGFRAEIDSEGKFTGKIIPPVNPPPAAAAAAATTTEDTILGLPKEAVYIGGAVVGFAGLCWLAGRGKKSSALSDKPKRRRKRKAKTTTKARKRRKRK